MLSCHRISPFARNEQTERRRGEQILCEARNDRVGAAKKTVCALLATSIVQKRLPQIRRAKNIVENQRNKKTNGVWP